MDNVIKFHCDVMDSNYDAIIFISKYHYFKNPRILEFKNPRVAFFADIIKIVTMFIKKIFKDSKKFKRVRNYEPKWNLYLYFFI